MNLFETTHQNHAICVYSGRRMEFQVRVLRPELRVCETSSWSCKKAKKFWGSAPNRAETQPPSGAGPQPHSCHQYTFKSPASRLHHHANCSTCVQAPWATRANVCWFHSSNFSPTSSQHTAYNRETAVRCDASVMNQTICLWKLSFRVEFSQLNGLVYTKFNEQCKF